LPGLLVVIVCISVLTAILLPLLAAARARAKRLLCMTNQREIVNGVSLFAADNDGKYPNPVATSRRGVTWSWLEPTMMTAYGNSVSRPIPGCFPGEHRSLAAYLHKYIADASIMFCPNAPSKYKYLQESWDAGDDWDNPETTAEPQDMVLGTYCFYWNYVGYLDGDAGPFIGPLGSFYRRDRSKLLVSDYFGYDYWRSPDAYGSCERIKGAAVTEGSSASSAYWSVSGQDDSATLAVLKVELHAGYMDGHVERYGTTEVVPMKVSWTPDGSEAFPSWLGKGIFYLPQNSLR
jgi:type II secretory pathway pseudopilin PulG